MNNFADHQLNQWFLFNSQTSEFNPVLVGHSGEWKKDLKGQETIVTNRTSVWVTESKILTLISTVMKGNIAYVIA